jgi:hypothetical protein
MADKDVMNIKNIVDITDQLKQKDRRRNLLTTARESKEKFFDAYRPRRQRLLEINAIYRNKSYLDKNKSGWQSKTFLPYSYNAVEKKTSILHQALWGNRLGSPYSAMGRTPEDHDFAGSAEAVLNNTMDRIGFFGTSQEGIRSCVKYGLGVYRYGWVRRQEEMLWREVMRDNDGKVKRGPNGKPTYRFVRRKYKTNQPFVKAVDIVDHFGWDPSAKKIDKWECGFAYEICEETPEEIYEKEQRGVYEKGSFDRLKNIDPHSLNDSMDIVGGDVKEPQIKRDEGMEMNNFRPMAKKYNVMHWYGWFDIDGDGLREFVKAVIILDNNQILSAEENLLGEYPFVDVQYSQSLHSLTPWGVLDPVVELQYTVNEFTNQRGDSVKLKLHPQFMINTDMILEDHAYVSMPGAFHPFAVGDGALRDAMAPMQFQNMEHLGINEEDRLLNVWRETTGQFDVQQAVAAINRTPATTLISLLNEQQATNSMLVNGILDKHGMLGNRVLKLIQLFGDEEFVLRTAGRKGIEFKRETLENILGEFDIKVTTSTFFGNKEIELQQLIQLRPFWVDVPHIDLVEVDKAIVELVLPKKMDKIMRVPDEPLSIIEEQALFVAGQGESVKLSELEDMASLTQKLRAHEAFENSKPFEVLEEEDITEFNTHLERIRNRIEQLQIEQQLRAAEAARGAQPQGPGGNMQNLGSPNMRTARNQTRPQPNNVPQQ